MASQCQHFALLEQRFSELSRTFVDDQVTSEMANPTTFVPDLDRLAAFRLLMHAELEHFLEEKAKERLASVTGLIAQNAPWMRQLPGFVALAIQAERPLPQIELSDTAGLSSYAKDVIAAAGKRIKENNGVKAESFAFLSACAGKTTDEIDGVLSNSLNSYGKGRGDVAHKSVVRTNSLQAPSTERNTIEVIVRQLAVFFDVRS